MTGKALSERLRWAEHLLDVPSRERIRCLQEKAALVSSKQSQGQFEQAIKRIQRQAKGAKYQVYFQLEPIIAWAFQETPSERGLLLDCALMQLRLVTMMRSVDCANLVWGLFAGEGRFYVRTVTKQGVHQLFNVTGQCLEALVAYLGMHVEHPAPYLFRHLKNPSWCLSSERLAKRALLRLGALNVNIDTYKSHSLRGAVATHLLRKQVPKSWVQERGGWKSSTTMDQFYNRLHLHQDWQRLLGGCQGVSASVDRQNSHLCSGAEKLALVETTQEVGAKASEQDTAQRAILSAHGILRDLHCAVKCVVCGHALHLEATYCCCRCRHLVHVRCLVVQEHVFHRHITHLRCCLDCNGLLPLLPSLDRGGGPRCADQDLDQRNPIG